ncbi:MAG: TlpA family protein disulfide reductase [Candidatus Electrothrix sp. AR4]|nr:TlpA family protein disulfide reductase [Candidatus Electrothrix sp. AR4]
MNKIIPKKIISLASLLLLLAISNGAKATPMPNFTLPSVVDGKDVNSNAFKGKVLLVTFFATWCPPCRQEIPTLIQLQKELAEKGFSVLALSMDEGGPDIVGKLVKQDKINYPVLMADNDVVSGFGGISGIPTSFLISSEGKMIRTYPGYVPHELLKQDIEEIMPKKSKQLKKNKEQKK